MMIRRLTLMAAASLAVLGLAACNDEGALPRNSRHYVPISLETQQALREKGMRTHAPILIRTFKKESELEVWKQDSSGKMALLKSYPMCRWSGQLGPKVREGDRQVPEGFYAFSANAMNPRSAFYLSFNVGYPNQLDRSLGRTGAHIMVHGDCSSMGCFAMTDTQAADIYALTREAFAGGQQTVQLQSFPFRMTPDNLAKYRNDPHMGFWNNLKTGNDIFEVTKREPKVSVCRGKYAFDANGDGCTPAAGTEDVRELVAQKQRVDEIKIAELSSKGVKPMKRIYRDGDMHPVFKESILAQDGGAAAPVGTTRNGISRADALAYQPVDLPLDQYQAHRSKGRSHMQIAELVNQERAQAAIESAKTPAKTEPAKTEPAKVEPAKAEPAKATTPATAIASTAPKATPAAATTRTVATSPAQSAPAAAKAGAEPAKVETAKTETPKEDTMLQRMLGTVGLGGKKEEPAQAAKPEDKQQVTVPVPQRRQADVPAQTDKLAPSLVTGSTVSPR